MRKFICLLATVGYILMASSGAAKVYWLPDYLGDNTNRSNGVEEDHRSGVIDNERGCPNGWLSETQKSGMACDFMGSYPWVGNCYSNCRCNTEKYPYTSDNCTGTKVPSGDECNDGTIHYKECIDACDFVEGLTNCPYGCQTTYEAEGCASECKVCYGDNCHNRTSVEGSCSYGCETYWSDCPSKCQKCYADNCRNRTDNATDLGCDTYWQDCASKCEVGKTCVPTDCSAYTLSSIPTNATYSSCSVGCGDSTKKYKIDSCNTGYTKNGNECVASACACGYATTASGCGSSFSNGSWSLGTSYSGYSGSSKCYKCSRKCNSGYELSGTTCVVCTWNGYTLTSCPTNGTCANSTCGGTTKYSFTGCESGYELNASQTACNKAINGAIKITYKFEAGDTLGFYLTGKYGTINWGDGTIEDYNGSSSVSHTYNTSGTYQFTIKGDISKIYIKSSNVLIVSFDQLDLESLKETNSGISSSKSFAGDCSEATGTIPQLPDTLTKGNDMFRDCSGLTGGIPELPSSLTDVGGMFSRCSGLEGAAPDFPPLINKDTCGRILGECSATFYNTSITNNGSWPDSAWASL